MEKRQKVLKARAYILKSIREFFWQRKFLEVDTPSLVLSPGMEPHIRPWKAVGKDFQGNTMEAFLPTSPEFAMKRILASGFPNIFQICKAYRAEPLSSTHNPEFAILEWYRSPAGYVEIMDDVEALFDYLTVELSKHGFTESNPSLSQSVLRISVKEAFATYSNEALEKKIPEVQASLAIKEEFNDWFFRIMLNEIEPKLAGLKRPVILFDYPHTQAALANLFTDEVGQVWAKRFEVYAGGL